MAGLGVSPRMGCARGVRDGLTSMSRSPSCCQHPVENPPAWGTARSGDEREEQRGGLLVYLLLRRTGGY